MCCINGKIYKQLLLYVQIEKFYRDFDLLD